MRPLHLASAGRRVRVRDMAPVTEVTRIPRAPLDPTTAPRSVDGPMVVCEGIVHVFAGDGRCQCGEMVHRFGDTRAGDFAA